MPKRSSDDVQDENQIANRIVQIVTEEQRILASGRNPHAVALGRLGGQKGGKARAAKLSARRRSEIARKAARTLWAKRRARKS